MTVLATPDGCSNDVFFCDPIACYPASVHLSIAPFGIGAGDTTMGALVPHIDPGFCCGDYAVNYCLFDVNNEGDSVNVMVYYNVGGNHCTNGIGEINDGAFLSIAYPDPAAGHLAIHYSYAEQVNRASLEFYDLSGRKIGRAHV